MNGYSLVMIQLNRGCFKPGHKRTPASIEAQKRTIAKLVRKRKWVSQLPEVSAKLRGPNPLKGRPGKLNGKYLPIGTRRLHRSTDRLIYWRVKVADPNQWRYEHRLVAEKMIGRKLARTEHAHHHNGDTLDNSHKNIIVMSSRDHTRHHLLITTWSKQYAACVICGEINRPHAGYGKCRRCYQRA